MAETITIAQGETATVDRTVTDPNTTDTLTVTGTLTQTNGTPPDTADPAWLTITTIDDGVVNDQLQQRLQMEVDGWAAKAAGINSFVVEGSADDATNPAVTRAFTFTLTNALVPATAPTWDATEEAAITIDGA